MLEAHVLDCAILLCSADQAERNEEKGQHHENALAQQRRGRRVHDLRAMAWFRRIRDWDVNAARRGSFKAGGARIEKMCGSTHGLDLPHELPTPSVAIRTRHSRRWEVPTEVRCSVYEVDAVERDVTSADQNEPRLRSSPRRALLSRWNGIDRRPSLRSRPICCIELPLRASRRPRTSRRALGGMPWFQPPSPIAAPYPG